MLLGEDLTPTSTLPLSASSPLQVDLQPASCCWKGRCGAGNHPLFFCFFFLGNSQVHQGEARRSIPAARGRSQQRTHPALAGERLGGIKRRMLAGNLQHLC